MNITLMGMAGVGKSTVGVELAGRLNWRFIDTDALIEEKTGLALQEILDKFGDARFTEIEEESVLELGALDKHIISPGGSVVYSETAMTFLKRISVVVFLNADFGTIKDRLANKEVRGIVGLKRKSLELLYDERLVLYRKYADREIALPEHFDIDMTVQEIIEQTRGKQMNSEFHRRME